MPLSEGATNAVMAMPTVRTTMTTSFYNATTSLMVRCIPGRGVVVDFYNDDEDEDDNDGDYNEEDHCPCLFQKVLPMQSTAMPTVRTTTTTSFYDPTTNLMVRCIPGRGGGV